MVKLLSGVAAVVCLIGLSLVGATIMNGAAASCAPRSALSGSATPVDTYDADQVSNAATIVMVGRQLGVPARGWIVAAATALQESGLRRLDHGDRDSLGLFQQRPSQGWGTRAQLLDPATAAQKFYQRLGTVPGWQSMSLTEAAQRVQRSAYPDAYAKWEHDATQLVSIVVSGDPRAIPVDREQCVRICPWIATSPDGSGGSCVEASAVFHRAQLWLTAWRGGPVPYLSSNVPGDLFGGYRRDCSGYVSMALGLQGPGMTTVELAQRSTMIGKSQLRPGDLMINPDTDLRGHVVLFAGWVDASMASYYGYEQSGDGGTHFRKIPYPYFGSYPMSPHRLGIIALDATQRSTYETVQATRPAIV
ncbi:NlpC/P60 family protein [Actinoplanes sp. TBRC 11911]|uniref:NlpC/P60 family protein n=1 Tax=Actinoplanes sp. TBRC 11911 TaxID=2729386 RepID=UPI00145D3248|nr:NlpC/P60 family protein [Actinoplanes sp. TBRC 11911]NMO57889.1 NlpC/P60 family protein [Actinoplanes sp. TBRC 11911]